MLNYMIISSFLLSILQLLHVSSPLLLHPDSNNQVKKYPSMADHLWNISWLIYNKKIFTTVFPRLYSFAPTCRKYTKLFSKFALPLIFLKYYKNIQFSDNKTLKSHIFNLLNYSLRLSLLRADTSTKQDTWASLHKPSPCLIHSSSKSSASSSSSPFSWHHSVYCATPKIQSLKSSFYSSPSWLCSFITGQRDGSRIY